MSFDYLDHYTMKQNRLKVLKESKYKCALCGAKATEVHHKDGSKSNHKTDNMLPLCHKCHMKLHKQERKNTKPKVDSIAIEHLLTLRGMSKQELAEKLGMSVAAVSTILKKQTTKNTTLKKIADVLCCDIESIVIKPNNPIDFNVLENKEEKEILIEAINERIDQLTTDKHLKKLYKIWITKDLREFFKVRSYGLLSGKDIETSILIAKRWHPGADISKLIHQIGKPAAETA